MNRCKHIVFNKLLVNQDSILVVITLPGHKSDKNVSAQTYFAVLRRRTVGDYIALFNSLSLLNNRALVHASALV